MKLGPARAIHGQVVLPGDKSISHRAAMIAALADGRSRLANYARSQDCISTLKCMRQLGVSIDTEGADVYVTGKGLQGLSPPSAPLDCGNSGSTMRMLAGVLAGQTFSSQLTGDASLTSRPMRRIIEPLEMMGAKIASSDGKPPLRISRNGQLQAVNYELPVASAQVKSCVLLAGLHAEGNTSVREREATRDHTERMLRWFGADVEVTTGSDSVAEITIAGGGDFSARDVAIPGDISSAAFLIAAAVLLPGSNVTFPTVGLNPTRTQFLSELKSFGANIALSNVQEVCNEPVGTLTVTGGLSPQSDQQAPRKIAGRLVPQLIDEWPLLAVVGTQIPGGLEIRDAGELRVKESDRLSTTAENLRAMGAEVEEFADGLKVPGPQTLHGALLDSHGDHRIAMAFTVGALVAQGESSLQRSECVAVSFPGFFQLLESLLMR
jgi:3-phosphoshikimate 1-carboxyvinyltransferase